MFALFQTLSDRLKALFVADVALDLEAQLLSRQADRTAELLVQAEQHDRHGFPTVAARLRAQAEALSLARPLAGVLPAPEHWRDGNSDPDVTASPTSASEDMAGAGTPRTTRLPAARRRQEARS